MNEVLNAYKARFLWLHLPTLESERYRMWLSIPKPGTSHCNTSPGHSKGHEVLILRAADF